MVILQNTALTFLEGCRKTKFSQLRFHVMSKSRDGPTDSIDGLRCLVSGTWKLGFAKLSKPTETHAQITLTHRFNGPFPHKQELTLWFPSSFVTNLCIHFRQAKTFDTFLDAIFLNLPFCLVPSTPSIISISRNVHCPKWYLVPSLHCPDNPHKDKI